MSSRAAETWQETGDIDVEWNGVVPDSPATLHDTVPPLDPLEAQSERAEDSPSVAYLGRTASAQLFPPGTSQLGPELYMG